MKKLFSRFCLWLRRLSSEDNGNPSSVRAVMLLWHVAVILVWVTVSFLHQDMASINEGVLAVLALVGGQKVIQKTVEQRVGNAPKTAPRARCAPPVDTPPGA